jgi:hypothetical protein
MRECLTAGGVLSGLLMTLVICMLTLGCTVKPRVSGGYHGTSGSGGEGAGSLIFSQPF